METFAPIRYRIFPLSPGAHLFQVGCTVNDPDPDGQRFSLPAWIPGSYLIREFAKNIVRLDAQCGGHPVKTTKLDKDTWRCEPCAGPLIVSYEVYAWDLSVRSAHLDATHGYFNGTSVFLLPNGKADHPCLVEILPPAGADYGQWRVATALTRDSAPAHGFGIYRAANYDELVDHPVEMGTFTLAAFEACGVPHEIAVTGRHEADMDRLTADLRRTCEHHIRFFGEPAPFDRYLFLVTAVGEGYGGLEHRASTSLLCSRDNLPRAGDPEVGEDYRTFLGLCSHEYFHAWNVKRIKPAAFSPYDLSREAYTRQLWVFEGITSYYDDLALARCGLIDGESYLELLGQTLTRYLRGSGRFKQSLADSSFDAWTKFYRQDENAPNAIVSYYVKGAVVALTLDLLIRGRTGGASSLDQVMVALWRRYGLTGLPVPEEGLETLAEEVTGLQLKEFFDLAIRQTGDLPLTELLASVGVDFRLRAATSDKDKGGRTADKDGGPTAALGARFSGGPEARLTHVFDGGAAQASGLSAGDVVVALDGLRVGPGDLDRRIGRRQPGTTVRIHAFRRDELMSFEVVLQSPPADTCYLTLRPDAEHRSARAAWLGLLDPDAG